MDFEAKPTHLTHLATSIRMDSQRESELVAVDWAERAGYTVGQKQRNAPRGLMPSDEYSYVAKWRNMDREERAALAGAIVFGSTWVEIWLRPGEHAAADDYVPPPASGMSCTPPIVSDAPEGGAPCFEATLP